MLKGTKAEKPQVAEAVVENDGAQQKSAEMERIRIKEAIKRCENILQIGTTGAEIEAGKNEDGTKAIIKKADLYLKLTFYYHKIKCYELSIQMAEYAIKCGGEEGNKAQEFLDKIAGQDPDLEARLAFSFANGRRLLHMAESKMKVDGNKVGDEADETTTANELRDKAMGILLYLAERQYDKAQIELGKYQMRAKNYSVAMEWFLQASHNRTSSKVAKEILEESYTSPNMEERWASLYKTGSFFCKKGEELFKNKVKREMARKFFSTASDYFERILKDKALTEAGLVTKERKADVSFELMHCYHQIGEYELSAQYAQLTIDLGGEKGKKAQQFFAKILSEESEADPKEKAIFKRVQARQLLKTGSCSEGTAILRNSAEENDEDVTGGHANSMYKMAIRYFEQNSNDIAFQHLGWAIAKGHIQAIKLASQKYFEQSNYKVSAEWALKLAEKDSRDEYRVPQAIGIPTNQGLSILQGDSDGQRDTDIKDDGGKKIWQGARLYCLGSYYLRIAQKETFDDASVRATYFNKALQCFVTSAELGNADAPYALGLYHENQEGQGKTFESQVASAYWYKVAALNGNEEATNKLKKVFAGSPNSTDLMHKLIWLTFSYEVIEGEKEILLKSNLDQLSEEEIKYAADISETSESSWQTILAALQKLEKQLLKDTSTVNMISQASLQLFIDKLKCKLALRYFPKGEYGNIINLFDDKGIDDSAEHSQVLLLESVKRIYKYIEILREKLPDPSMFASNCNDAKEIAFKCLLAICKLNTNIPEAQQLLARCYQFGIGVTKSPEQATTFQDLEDKEVRNRISVNPPCSTKTEWQSPSPLRAGGEPSASSPRADKKLPTSPISPGANRASQNLLMGTDSSSPLARRFSVFITKKVPSEADGQLSPRSNGQSPITPITPSFPRANMVSQTLAMGTRSSSPKPEKRTLIAEKFSKSLGNLNVSDTEAVPPENDGQLSPRANRQAPRSPRADEREAPFFRMTGTEQSRTAGIRSDGPPMVTAINGQKRCMTVWEKNPIDEVDQLGKLFAKIALPPPRKNPPPQMQ
jgi:TPR repeat protein